MSFTSYDTPNRPATGERSRFRYAPTIISKEDTDLLEMCNDWYTDARRNRLQFERQWYLNLAFFFGRQWVQWTSKLADSGISRLYEPPTPPWRARLVSNKIRPYVRKEIAKLIKEKPQPFVIPASTDDDDLAAARAGEAIFEHLTRVLGYDPILRRSMFWMVICGTSFVKDWYDPFLTDDEGVQGKCCIEPVTPFQLFVPDTQEENIDNQPYVIHELGKDPHWVEQVYGVAVPPDSSAGSGLLEQRFLNAVGGQAAPKRYVSVKECWIKPCKKFPDGAVITWAGETLLSKGIDPDDKKAKPKWPFTYKDFPFTRFSHIPTGAFYGGSAVEDVIPLQKEYNRTRSQIIESKNRMSKPQLMAARGSIDANKVTSEPGLIIWYTPGFPVPVPLPLQNLPGYVIEELQRCQGDMDDIVGQHEISKGHAPTGVSAATAISFLQEQDDSMITPSITAIEEGTARIGRHLLSHVAQFWDAERTVRALGENNAYETYMFAKASINGNTDLNVQAGSATPRSQAAKQAFITELMEKQFIPVERGLRYLGMAETNRMYEELQVSARQAQRENLRMKDGEPLTTNTWDEDPIHLEEHNLFRRRQAFERLPDETKAIFEQHCQQHKQKIALQMGQPIAPGEPLPSPEAIPGQNGQRSSASSSPMPGGMGI